MGRFRAGRVHIGVDFDDVLYPYHHYLKRRLQRRFGIDLTRRRVTTFYYDVLPEFGKAGITREQVWAEVQATWDEVESHAEAPLLDPQAAPVLRDLARRHRVTVVTARHNDAKQVLRRFLDRHRIRPHDILVGRLEKKGFDALIDDFPSHALENAAGGGWSLLYTIDENSTFDETRHPRVVRVASWSEVRQVIERLEAVRRA
jgi:uncharacterized HAD superfamily protein